MDKYVLKFGGTSLKNAESIKRVNKIITNFYEINKPRQLIIVDSAPGKIGDKKLEDKITNLLEKIFLEKNIRENVNEIFDRFDDLCVKFNIPQPNNLYTELKTAIDLNENDEKSYSRLVSLGERIIVNIHGESLYKEMKKRRIPVKSFDFADFGMITDKHKDAYATIDSLLEIEKKLDKEDGILIIPGFVGYNEKEEVTTLGRDGSNYTAAKIAEAIDAKEVFIFSDEPGVRRANPNLIPDAEIIKELSYEEAIEFAELGAKIINAKCIYPVKRDNIPINIVDEKYNGTKISSSVSLENMGAKIITSSGNHSIINITYENDKPGVLSDISKYFRDSKINIESIADERHSVSLAFSERDNENLEYLIKRISQNYKFKLENQFSRISVIGEGMRNQVGVVNKISSAYKNKGISFEMISQGINQLNITTFIKEDYERIAVKELYNSFFK
ncbi:MAG: aspartate kinase [Nanoarchaeota archaeon]